MRLRVNNEIRVNVREIERELTTAKGKKYDQKERI